jgi:hypothetical protein
VDEPVADPLEHCDVAGDSGEVVCRCVDAQLLRPEVEAVGVDLGGRAIAEPEVEHGLRDVEG